MEIKRDAYLQQLIERKDNGMIKVITGIRRCGKSFLLFTIFKRYLLENGVDVDHIIPILCASTHFYVMLINIFSDFFDCSVYNRLLQSLL